ncbi:hypothetical protein FRC17_006692 [Serendipita sp. 399]|nr:hypothetical protein FRC17_006692 [Serendipita sp. 399]
MGLGTIVFRKAMVTTTLEDERTWEVETGIPIRDFSMDVFQDLIVIVCYRNTGLERQVRFHSMSTGKDHPLARRPVVEIKATEPRLTSCNIAINNDVVGIIFQDQIVHSNQRLDANVLAVWAWKSGDLLLYLPSNLDNVVDSLSFLSPNHVLVGWRALFHREAQNMHEKSSLDVYDLSRGAEASPIKRFLLPELDEAATVLEFTICCDSTPTPSQHCPRPFYASPDHKICKIQIVFGYQLSGLMMRESPISLFLFTHVFLQEYGPSVTPPDETMETIIVPWDQWGNNTRTTLWNPAESVYNICVNGSRVIRKIPTNVPNRFKLQLCDFNPYAISSIESLPGKPTSNYRYVHPSHDNVLEMRVFKQKVYSPLPYLEITTKKSFEAHDVMLDHDNIYLVRTREIEVLSF